MNSVEHEAFLRGKVVALAESMLNCELGIIAGSRRLWRLGAALNVESDEDFVVFKAIDSETDDLPVDYERSNWSQEGLKRKDAEITAAETWAKEYAVPACKNLIRRFSDESQ